MHVVRWIAEAIAWAVVATTWAMLVTQALGWCGSRFVAIAQALTPVLGGASLLAAIFGRAWSDTALTITGLIGALGCAVVIAPAYRRRGHAPAADPAGTVRLFHANLLYGNTADPVALARSVLATDADVLALSELHVVHERALLADPDAARYPHRVHRSATNADGMAIWSRLPLSSIEWVDMPIRPALLSTIQLPNGAGLRLLLAHPNPPTTRRGLRSWEPAMIAFDEIARHSGQPALIVADLNAAHWHPPLRRLTARGWRDAHEVAGRGFSVSWPTAGVWPIPFVRLDHALAGDGVDVVAVADVDVPGSDHRGFVVTVAVTAPSA